MTRTGLAIHAPTRSRENSALIFEVFESRADCRLMVFEAL
jgi:hypothetical protein